MALVETCFVEILGAVPILKKALLEGSRSCYRRYEAKAIGCIQKDNQIAFAIVKRDL